MVRTYITETQQALCGGKGEVKFEYWVAEEEKSPNLDLCVTLSMTPGATVGEHKHEGNTEIYRVLSGEGMYNDNGNKVKVGKGDVLVCYDGEMHGIENTGDGELVFDAIIVRS